MSDTETNIFSDEIISQIMLQKANNPNKFQSCWEKDEEDIEMWTEKEISEDPGKQLLIYSENGEFNKVKQILDKFPTLITFKDNDGYSALHRASYSNNLEIVKYLIDFGANIEAKTEMGWTPLHSASHWNNYEIVEYLLMKNANVNALTNSGQSPLHLAASQRNCKETIICLLMNPFIDVTLKNNLNETVTELARRSCEYYRLFEIIDENLNELQI